MSEETEEFEETQCAKCTHFYDLREGEAPSKYCDKCAHDMVDELEQKLIESEAANTVMREALEVIFGKWENFLDDKGPWLDRDLRNAIVEARKLISTTAGKPLLEELDRLKKQRDEWASLAGKNGADAILFQEERDRLKSALEKLPYKDFVGRNDIDAAEFVDHSNDFMEAMEAAHKAIETPQPKEKE